MLENERSGVSLQRLQLIADRFGLPVTELLAEPAEAPVEHLGVEVIRQMAANIPSVERGKGVTYQIPVIGARHAMQPALLTFAPGAGFLGDPIGHDGEEFVFVLFGQIELHRGEEKVVLNQGDGALFTSGQAHAYHNGSQQGPAMIVIIATPPW
jgi:quercetin dioxygenase-like cupin family protein